MMKIIITVLCLLLVSIAVFSATAKKIAPTAYPDSEIGKSMSQLIMHERSMFSGRVLETEEGVAISTNRGTFLLKGADLRELVGKKVLVTGVMREGAILAVKIDVLEL